MFKKVKKKIIQLNEIQYLYALAGVVFLTAISLLFWFSYDYFRSKFPGGAIVNPNPVSGGETGEPVCDFQRLLDGICVGTEEEINPSLVAIMIDNHMDAYPQSGLAEAIIVYEAPVEGNYTRFMAVYPANTEVNKVGPVRSTRPYFLDWVKEYAKTMYMHVGGSPEALQKIQTYGIFDLNEFYQGWYYWRDYSRYAPYNTYTSSQLWNKALEDYGDGNQVLNIVGWQYNDIESCLEDCIDEITVNFLPPYFKVIWRYSSSTEQYERYQAGRRHQDLDGEEIVADNVIVQLVKTIVLDGVGRLQIETIGSGRAIVFTRGKAIEGEWRKESRQEKTRWYNDSGEEIVLRSGVTWVEVINGRGRVEWE